MINEEIISYIKNAKEHGISLDAIRMNLKTGGWNDTDIDEAFTVTERTINLGMTTSPPLKPIQNLNPSSNPNVANQEQNGFVSATPFTPVATKKSSFTFILILIIIFLILGGTGFAFYKKIIPLPSFINKYLEKPPYTEENLISGLLFKMAQINTVKYTTSGQVSLGPREVDAKPLILTGDLAPTNFDQTEYFPTEFKINASITTEADLKNFTNSDWKINFDTSGDFGDLYYQVNVDSIKKGENIYFKINNLPTLFSVLPIPKSQWFLLDFDSIDKIIKQKVSEEEYKQYLNETSDSTDEFRKSLLEYETTYKESREKAMRITQKFFLMADEYKILAFKEIPAKDEITTVPLYRYSLMFRPNTLAPFLEAFTREVMDQEFPEDKEINDDFILELKSENALQVIKYIEENTNMLLWVDENGLPESFKYKFRIVPGNVNANFNEKQINFEINLKIQNINQPLIIEAPANAKSFFQYIFDSLETAKIKAINANIMSNLASIRLEAELFYDKKGNYGAKTSGGCSVSGTLFASPQISNTINEINDLLNEEKIIGKVVCFGNKDDYAISAPLLDIGDGQKYFCVDSSLEVRETRSHAISTTCPSF